MIINKRNKKIVTKREIECRSFFSKLRGLMFRSKFPFASLLFYLDRESREDASIHMLFVFFPIDVVWLNKEWRVVDLREKVMPFTPLVVPKRAAKYVLELPVGRIRRREVRVGDFLVKK